MRALQTGHQIHERGADPEERLGDGEERAADHRLADLQLGLVGVLDAVAVDLVRLSAEHLGQQNPRHRQRLLGDRPHRRKRGLRIAPSAPPRASDSTAEQYEHRRDGQRYSRQQRREQQHRHHRRDQRDHVADDRRGGRRDRRLHTADVVGQPGLNLSAAGGRVERQRQLLEVLEQPVAQLLQHAIAHDLGQIHLDDVQDPVDDRDRDQRRHQRVQRAEIGATLNEQSLVEHLADQQRADHAQRRRRHDREDDQRQRTAMGAKQAHDSAAEPRRLGLRSAYVGSPHCPSPWSRER